MGALRLDSARPFDAKIEIHCAKYFKISVATPRPLKFSFSTNSRKLAEQKNPQPVGCLAEIASMHAPILIVAATLLLF